MKICIDAGHGGYDPGACGNGLKEKDLTLKLALKVAAGLRGICDVLLTRNSDATPWNSCDDLQKRCDIANNTKADYFMSIHVNSASGTAGTGFENYIYTSASVSSVQLGQKVHDGLASFYKSKGFVDRGFKRANLYVLHHTNMPATLIENLFINNPKDAKFLKDDAFLIELANAIVQTLINTFNLKSPIPNTTVSHLVIVDSKQVANLVDASKIASLVQNTIVKGYSTIEIKHSN